MSYFPQNPTKQFKSNLSLVDWMAQWSHEEDDLETVRGNTWSFIVFTR